MIKVINKIIIQLDFLTISFHLISLVTLSKKISQIIHKRKVNHLYNMASNVHKTIHHTKLIHFHQTPKFKIRILHL
jgi:hypothetical protein